MAFKADMSSLPETSVGQHLLSTPVRTLMYNQRAARLSRARAAYLGNILVLITARWCQGLVGTVVFQMLTYCRGREGKLAQKGILGACEVPSLGYLLL